MKIQISELKGKSAFDLCRRLLHDGHGADEVLEVYRGDTLSYTVSSIGWGARHVLREGSKTDLYAEKWRPMGEKDKERLRSRRKPKDSSV